MPDTVQVHQTLIVAAARLGEMATAGDGSGVGDLAGSVTAMSLALETLDTWERRRVRDRAFADAIDEVIDGKVPLHIARARLAKVAADLRGGYDEPDPFEEAGADA